MQVTLIELSRLQRRYEFVNYVQGDFHYRWTDHRGGTYNQGAAHLNSLANHLLHKVGANLDKLDIKCIHRHSKWIIIVGLKPDHTWSEVEEHITTLIGHLTWQSITYTSPRQP